MPKLLRELKQFYKTNARQHLPWRKTRDPYKILVSEMMLQQTQVRRVVPFYNAFIKQFPTARALSRAPLGSVLEAWQGLGYNRRAKYLREAAKVIAKEGFVGQKLPGVGPYTAAAVAAFAFNKPEVLVETNIRTVLFHYVDILSRRNVGTPTKASGQNNRISDRELLPIIGALLQKSNMQPRDFYAAMMDYGAHLKRQGVRLNHKSTQYAKQPKFEGSMRELRGAIVRELLRSPATETQLIKKFPSRGRGEVAGALEQLVAEGLLRRRGAAYAAA